MFNVTTEAVALLIAAKRAEGGAPTAGIRIKMGTNENWSKHDNTLAIGFAISDEPQLNDQEFQQNGLKIFVDERLIEPLDDRTLDVGDGMHLIFR